MSKVELTAKPAIAMRGFLGFSRKASPWDSERPIREELFSGERLEAHAKSFAVAQTVASRPTRGGPLAARLADNSVVLLSAYRSIVKAIDEGRQVTPAGEWLIDNYHLVETQIRQISTDLPPGHRQLKETLSRRTADLLRGGVRRWRLYWRSRSKPQRLALAKRGGGQQW